MSSQQTSYPHDSKVFSGGRCLDAFEHLEDIDGFELNILTQLAAKLPGDQGYIGQAIQASLSTLCRWTKLVSSTIRRRIKSLEDKGYLKVVANLIASASGRMHFGPNKYLLTAKVFQNYAEAIGQEEAEQQPSPPPSAIPEIQPVEQVSPFVANETIIETIMPLEASIVPAPAQESPSEQCPERISHISTAPQIHVDMGAILADDALPSNQLELIAILKRKLEYKLPEDKKSKLRTLIEVATLGKFSLSLDLYKRHAMGLTPEVYGSA